MQKYLTLALVVIATVLISCRALSADYKVVGHFGDNFGARKTYYFNQKDKSVSWDQHIIKCKENGLEPVRIESDYEQEYVFSLARSNSEIVSYIYVGASKSGNEWVWEKTFERITYDMIWQIGQPDNASGIESCLTIGHDENGAGYNDIACDRGNLTHVVGFFCQKVGN